MNESNGNHPQKGKIYAFRAGIRKVVSDPFIDKDGKEKVHTHKIGYGSHYDPVAKKAVHWLGVHQDNPKKLYIVQDTRADGSVTHETSETKSATHEVHLHKPEQKENGHWINRYSKTKLQGKSKINEAREKKVKLVWKAGVHPKYGAALTATHNGREAVISSTWTPENDGQRRDIKYRLHVDDKEHAVPGPHKYPTQAKELAHKIVTGMHESYDDSDELNETTLNLQQRQKRAIIMHRYQSKIERARELAKKRMAPKENIKKRAYAKARQLVRARVAGSRGADYHNLGPSEKIAIDRALEGKQKAIKRLALRLIPRVKAAEQKRLSSYMKGTPLENHGAKEGGSGHSSVAEDFNQMFSESFKKAPKKAEDADLVTKPGDDKKPADDKKVVAAALAKGGKLVKGNSNIIQFGKFEEAIKKKSSKSGISEEVLKEVYNRGFAAWTEESGVSQQQYAFARMNSFINQGKTYFNEDADLQELSTGKLDQYVTKAVGAHAAGHRGAQDARDSEKPYFAALRDRRKKGIADAINKIDAGTGREPEKPVKVPATVKEAYDDPIGGNKSVHVRSYGKASDKQINSKEFKKHVDDHGGEVDYVSDKGIAFKFKDTQTAASFHKGVQAKFRDCGPTHDMDESVEVLDEVSKSTIKSYLKGRGEQGGKDYSNPMAFRKAMEISNIAQAKLGKSFKRRPLPDVKVMATNEEIEELGESITMKALTSVTNGHNGKMFKDVFKAHGDDIHAKIQNVRKERDENMKKHGYKAGMFHDQMLKAYAHWNQGKKPVVKEETLEEAKGNHHFYVTMNTTISDKNHDKLLHPKDKPFTSESDAIAHIMKIAPGHPQRKYLGRVHKVDPETGRVLSVFNHNTSSKGYPYSPGIGDSKNVKDLKEDTSAGTAHRKTVEVVGRGTAKLKASHTKLSEIQKKIIDEKFGDAFAEEVRSSDVKGVVVKTASGKTVVRKQKVNRKIIDSGNTTDGKPDDQNT